MTITYRSAYDFLNEIYEHDFTDDQTNVIAQAKTELELLCMKAVDKQIPKKPTHIYEEHSEHLWSRDNDGGIDLYAFESRYCNGPICTRCYHSECIHCNDEWETKPTAPCVVDKYICPSCGSKLSWKRKYCHKCGQTLDWSELG